MKQIKITCYDGATGCVTFDLQLIKDGNEKTAVNAIDTVVGFYKNSVVVVAGDGQNGLNPNNPEPYNNRIELIDLDTYQRDVLYRQTTEKGSTTPMQLKLRIGS